jgi:hypothetical protein
MVVYAEHGIVAHSRPPQADSEAFASLSILDILYDYLQKNPRQCHVLPE